MATLNSLRVLRWREGGRGALREKQGNGGGGCSSGRDLGESGGRLDGAQGCRGEGELGGEVGGSGSGGRAGSELGGVDERRNSGLHWRRLHLLLLLLELLLLEQSLLLL